MLIDIRFAREKIYKAAGPVLSGKSPEDRFTYLIYRYGSEYIISGLGDQMGKSVGIYYKDTLRLRNRLADHMEKLC